MKIDKNKIKNISEKNKIEVQLFNKVEIEKKVCDFIIKKQYNKSLYFLKLLFFILAFNFHDEMNHHRLNSLQKF